MVAILFLLSLDVFSQEKDSQPGRQKYMGAGIITGTNTIGFSLDAGTLWNKDFGWHGSFRFKGAGAEDSKISYQTAKNYFGDSEVNSKYQFYSISLGRTYGFNDNFFVGAAIALQTYTQFVEFYDPTGILGSGGKYYVKKNEGSNFAIELSAIYSVPQNPYYIAAGYSNGLAGFSFGFGWTF